MTILLDTVAFLWATLDDPRFSKRARDIYTDPDNEVYLSVISGWEIAVKHSLGRLRLPQPPAEFVPARRKAYGIQTLALNEESALYVSRLPRPHADPFDRLLICQAVVHGLAILTPDPQITRYPVKTLW